MLGVSGLVIGAYTLAAVIGHQSRDRAPNGSQTKKVGSKKVVSKVLELRVCVCSVLDNLGQTFGLALLPCHGSIACCLNIYIYLITMVRQ